MKRQIVTIQITEKQANALLALIDSFEECRSYMGNGPSYRDADKVAEKISAQVCEQLALIEKQRKLYEQLHKIRDWARGAS